MREEGEGEDGTGDFIGHGHGGARGQGMLSTARDDGKTEATYLAVACEMAARFLSLNLVREDRTMAVVATASNHHTISRSGGVTTCDAIGTGPLINRSPYPNSRTTPASAVTHTTMDTGNTSTTDNESNYHLQHIVHTESRVVVRVDHATKPGADMDGTTVVAMHKRTFQAELDLEDQPSDTISPPPKRLKPSEVEGLKTSEVDPSGTALRQSDAVDHMDMDARSGTTHMDTPSGTRGVDSSEQVSGPFASDGGTASQPQPPQQQLQQQQQPQPQTQQQHQQASESLQPSIESMVGSESSSSRDGVTSPPLAASSSSSLLPVPEQGEKQGTGTGLVQGTGLVTGQGTGLAQGSMHEAGTGGILPGDSHRYLICNPSLVPHSLSYSLPPSHPPSLPPLFPHSLTHLLTHDSSPHNRQPPSYCNDGRR